MNEIDPRLVRISIEVNGQLKSYEGLALTASGTKYANANQNDCDIKISNVDTATKNFILTETSPFNTSRVPKRIIVEAGRASYGYARIYEGTIVSAIPTQPPDVTLQIKALTADHSKTDIIARSQPAQVPLSRLSQKVANDLGLTLVFQAQDKQIANYTYTGGALKQVDRLGDAGRVNAYVDDGNLVVKEENLPLTGSVRVLNMDTGLVGIPEVTEFGVKCKFMLDNQTTLGGTLRLSSSLNPSINGDYIIYKLGFDIASRDTPFYWIAEARRA